MLYYRLKKNKEYRKVYRYGRSSAHGNVVLFVLKNRFEYSRFGFTVSKKVGKAVVRNKVRRWFKEACRKHWSEFPQGYDYVVLAGRTIAEKNYHKVEHSLLKLLKKLV